MNNENHALNVKVIRTIKDFKLLRHDWDEIFLKNKISLPFLSFDWNFIWWHNFSRNNLKIKDNLIILALYKDNACVAIAPFFISASPKYSPIKIKYLHPFGADFNLTELRLVVCGEENLLEAHESIRNYFLEHQYQWDYVQWTGIPNKVYQTFDSAKKNLYYKEIPNFIITLEDTWELFAAKLKRNIKESIRHCYNSLKKENISFDFRVFSTIAEVEEILPHFFSLHSARANATSLPYHPDYFADPINKNFITEVIMEMAKKGLVNIYMIEIDNKYVATRIGFIVENSLYLYYSGFNPDYGRYSIMTTTLTEIIKHSIAKKIKHINLSIGRDVSKTRWGASEVMYHEYYEVKNTYLSKLFFNLFTKPKLEEKIQLNELVAESANKCQLSIIIPTYKRENEVLEAVKSCLKIANLKFEVLVLDDSPEGTARPYVENKFDERVKYIQREIPSKGKPAKVRNEAVSLTSGKYLYFLDDDDEVFAAVIEKLVLQMEANNSSVGIGEILVFGAPSEALAQEEKYMQKSTRILPKITNKFALTGYLLFNNSLVVCSSCVIKKSCLKTSGYFDEEIQLCEDVEFYLRSIREHGFVFIKEKILHRRVLENSLIHEKNNGNKIVASYEAIHNKYRQRRGAFEFFILKICAKILKILL